MLSQKVLRALMIFSGLASICVLVGCGSGGPPIGTVSGNVTLNGKPLSGALVTFNPAEGRASSGSTDENGNYELNFTRDRKGAIIGSHEVRITTSTVEGEGVVAPKEMVPKKYNDNSTLMAEVRSGVNAHVDFQLTSS